jgi:hypothetical protein
MVRTGGCRYRGQGAERWTRKPLTVASLNIERDELFRLPLASRTSLHAILFFISHSALMLVASQAVSGGESCPRPPILSREPVRPR